MYLRVTRQRRADGSFLSHLQIVESVWNKQSKRNDKRLILTCGRADDPKTTDRLRRLAKSILRRFSTEEIVADNPAWKLIDAWPHGDLCVLEAVWNRPGIADAVNARAGQRKLGFSVERALIAMVANRACSPASKLYCYEQESRRAAPCPGCPG